MNHRRAVTAAASAVTAATLLLSGTAVPAAVAQDSQKPEPVASLPATPTPGFRVTPYLQRPGATTMTINWISELATPGTLTINGKQYQSKSTYLAELEYTDAELKQTINGLEKGSWLKSNANYKHQVLLEDLTPATRYSYSVEQDGVTYNGTFRTAPQSEGAAGTWDPIRIVAFADSETEPAGRTDKSGAREWDAPAAYAPGSAERPGDGSVWFEKFGFNKRAGKNEPRYPLTQDRAFKENLAVVKEAKPDLVIMPGDLTQGSGYQPAWDEFWGYFAGEHGDLAGHVPLLPALGNWETYSAISGGYRTDGVAHGVHKGRRAYQAYIDSFGSDTPEHEDSYYRVDHGPVTVITLDSTNGQPDETYSEQAKKAIPGTDRDLAALGELGTDTNTEYTLEEARRAGNTDQPDFNPGSEQWIWAEKQLADARDKGQIIIVQFHHSAYSSGVHGTTTTSATPDKQPGTPMRVYSPLFEKYGVAAVMSGHDEMFERSWVDDDADGVGFHSFDVGVAADGLRGEYMVSRPDGTRVPARFNTYNEWMAQRDSAENWALIDGNPVLIDGGKHYGHLQVDFERLTCTNGAVAVVKTTPVYLFPVMDSQYNITSVERRVYDDVQTIYIGKDGKPLPRVTAMDSAPECTAVALSSPAAPNGAGNELGKGAGAESSSTKPSGAAPSVAVPAEKPAAPIVMADESPSRFARFVVKFALTISNWLGNSGIFSFFSNLLAIFSWGWGRG